MKPVIIAPLVALALAAGGAGAYLWLSSGGSEEEVVAQPTPTPQASATTSAAPTATPTPTPEPTATIPADWQTYVDPKGRFSIRVPLDWEKASFSTEDNPVWLQLGKSQPTDGELTDGVRLEVSVQAKQLGETPETLTPDFPDWPRLSLESVSINERTGLRASWGTDPTLPGEVAFVFERKADWLQVILWAAGPNANAYLKTFDDLVIKSFVIP